MMILRNCFRVLIQPLLLMAVLIPALATPVRATAADVTIGWTAWSDAELVTKLARRIIEDDLGHSVELKLLDIALQYQGVANGDVDAMLMAWLPTTHADYWERYGDRVDDLGVLYSGGRLGWVVPAYIPESDIGSIADLARPDIADRLQRQIFGIDPGAGLMRLSRETLEAYGLDRYNLIASSSAAMAAMVKRAEQRRKWIVATAWRPHWMFQEWDLRFLDDPKGALGGVEQIHALGRRGLGRDLPDVAAFIGRLSLSVDQVEAMMDRSLDTSPEAAVDAFIEAHPDLVHYWVTGEK